MSARQESYPARLDVDYPEQLDRLTTLLRVVWIIPILAILVLLTGGEEGVAAGLAFATAAMIVVRQRYPRWWFDFSRELARFEGRVTAYLALLTDHYPSTDEQQSVHIEIDYPDVEQDLNRWLPLVKWLLAIPHFIVLILLALLAVISVIVAWFAILITGRYPRGLFDFVVGVLRWALRVNAYAFLLVTDRYPPFRLS